MVSELESVSFDLLVDQLSEKVGFDEKEKIGKFVRKAVCAVLKIMDERQGSSTSFEGLSFGLANSLRLGVQFELKIMDSSREKGVELCALGLGYGKFLGMKEGEKAEGVKSASALELVQRIRIDIHDIKIQKNGIWVKTNASIFGDRKGKLNKPVFHFNAPINKK